MSLLILSLGLFACNESKIWSTDSIREKHRQDIQNLSVGCSVDSDCRIVALDYSCNLAYTSILESEIETYDQIVENFEKAVASQETLFLVCPAIWFPTYDRNNYESQCVENQCEAIYIEPESFFRN